MSNEPHVQILRSSLGRAKGNGTSRSGAAEWKTARVTSIALTPLSMWFIISMLHMASHSYDDVLRWMSLPIVMVLLIAMVVLTFLHLQLGLQVIIEDYVRGEGIKAASILLTRGICFALALLCVVSVVKVGLTGTHASAITIIHG